MSVSFLTRPTQGHTTTSTTTTAAELFFSSCFVHLALRARLVVAILRLLLALREPGSTEHVNAVGNDRRESGAKVRAGTGGGG